MAGKSTRMVGPRLLVDDELSSERMDATFNASLVWEDVYPERENQGPAEFAGQVCWKVVVQTAAGNERTLFFDQQSGLLHGMEMTMPSDMEPGSCVESSRGLSGCEWHPDADANGSISGSH